MNSKHLFGIIFLLFLISGCSSPTNKENAEKTISNPLYRPVNDLIAFSKLTPENIMEAAENAKLDAEKILEELRNENDISYNSIMHRYDEALKIIYTVSTPTELIFETHPDSAIREAAKNASELLKNYEYQIDADDKIYQKIKQFSQSEEYQSLSPDRKQFVDEVLLNYVNSGMDLSKEKQQFVKSLRSKIHNVGVNFLKNISSSPNKLVITDKDTVGIPQDFLAQNKKSDGTYEFDMSYPTYSTIMKFAKPEIRKKYFTLFKNRGYPENMELLDSLLYYRQTLASILGYKTYADYKLTERMAPSPEKVWDFENDLKEKFDAKANEDYQELLELKKSLGECGDKIEEYEVSRLLYILNRQKYSIDHEKVKKYFPLDNVINGIFKMTQTLFGLNYEEVKNPDVWHPDVRMFKCYDTETGKLIGVFYLDFFPRKNKYSHAACFSIYPGQIQENGLDIAQAALVCNFPKPTEDKPSLMKHSDVETFFHEFGHLVHSMVAKSRVFYLSGIDRVKLDFVEAPSQIYENWAYEKDVLKIFAKHYQTGESLSDEIIEKLIAAKNVYSGLAGLKQVFYGSYDMYLHNKYLPYQGETTDDVTRNLYPITKFDLTEDTHFQCNFGHLVGYGAGYYGYMWSKVFAQDMWSKFEEEGAMNKALGMKYRKLILEPGAQGDPYKAVTEFLGREPNSNALLKSMGVKQVEN
ncbi:MAG: hypothetical protein D6707_06560 [Bacteroidetes bacterium]|nr:MAG: hypothetical protein D6707_06560 [Bacteroidota bacterium]